MAMPGNYALQIYRGDTNKWDFYLWQDADKTQPTDLTDVITKAEIRDKPNGANITLMNTYVELPNIVHMSLSPSQSETMIVKGVWDLQLTFPNGDILTVLRGDVALTPDVTDSTVEARAGSQVKVVKGG